MKKFCLILLLVFCVPLVFAGCSSEGGYLKLASTNLSFSEFYIQNYGNTMNISGPVKMDDLSYQPLVESYDYNYKDFVDNMEYIDEALSGLEFLSKELFSEGEDEEVSPEELLRQYYISYYCCVLARNAEFESIAQEDLLNYIGTDENPGLATALANLDIRKSFLTEVNESSQNCSNLEELALITAVDAFDNNRQIDAKQRPLVNEIYEYKNSMLTDGESYIVIKVVADSKNTTLTTYIYEFNNSYNYSFDDLDETENNFSFFFKNEFNESKKEYTGISYKKHTSKTATATVVFDKSIGHMEIKLSTWFDCYEFMPDLEEYEGLINVTCETVIQTYQNDKVAYAKRLTYVKDKIANNFNIEACKIAGEYFVKYGYVSSFDLDLQKVKTEDIAVFNSKDLESMTMKLNFDMYDRCWFISSNYFIAEKKA